MGAPSTRYWNAWLPPQVAQEAAREEPKRFAAAVHGFQAAAQAAKASCHADLNSWASTLAWIDILKRWGNGSGWCSVCANLCKLLVHVICLGVLGKAVRITLCLVLITPSMHMHMHSLVSTKTEFDKADVRTLITTLMDVVLSTSGDTEVQVWQLMLDMRGSSCWTCAALVMLTAHGTAHMHTKPSDIPGLHTVTHGSAVKLSMSCVCWRAVVSTSCSSSRVSL